MVQCVCHEADPDESPSALAETQSARRGFSMKSSVGTVEFPKMRKVAMIERPGHAFLRYGLVIAIGWIAAMKVTEYEAKGIQPLIAHSRF
jgi:hypothetical protein